MSIEYHETKPAPQEFRQFRDYEEDGLEQERVRFVNLTEENIRGKEESVRPHKISIDGVSGLLQVPSGIIHFAIFSDQGKAFVADGKGKSLAKQENIVRWDLVELRKKKPLRELDIVIASWSSSENPENIYPVRLLVKKRDH